MEKEEENNGDSVFDTCEYDRNEIIRLAKKGFEIAGKRKKNFVVLTRRMFWRLQGFGERLFNQWKRLP